MNFINLLYLYYSIEFPFVNSFPKKFFGIFFVKNKPPEMREDKKAEALHASEKVVLRIDKATLPVVIVPRPRRHCEKRSDEAIQK